MIVALIMAQAVTSVAKPYEYIALRDCVSRHLHTTSLQQTREEALRDAFRSCRSLEYAVTLFRAQGELAVLADTPESKRATLPGNSDSERMLLVEAEISADVAADQGSK